MALQAGNAVKGTGLAGAIAKARKKGYPNYDPSKDKAINHEAEAIVDYLVDNIEVYWDEVAGEGYIK